MDEAHLPINGMDAIMRYGISGIRFGLKSVFSYLSTLGGFRSNFHKCDADHISKRLYLNLRQSSVIRLYFDITGLCSAEFRELAAVA
jgi:hypothetical protein